VLGGGGARGLAHLGVLRAFETCGVPIDAIGGTSIGALAGAGYAMGWSHEDRLRHATKDLIEVRRLFAPTLPLVSLTSASRLTRALRSNAMFGDVAIEDLPFPFFALSASFRRGDAVVHDRDALWLAVRASCSLPGIMPPVPVGDDLLVDGGVVNNVPVDVMLERLPGRALAVNLRADAEPLPAATFGASLSGWRVLASRLGRRDAIRLPGPATMMLRAKELGGRGPHDERLALADLLIEPPVDGVDSLDFRAGLSLVDRAYAHACERIEGWLAGAGDGAADPA
jgi:predicted acylesterase/phospholipase RssA